MRTSSVFEAARRCLFWTPDGFENFVPIETIDFDYRMCVPLGGRLHILRRIDGAKLFFAKFHSVGKLKKKKYGGFDPIKVLRGSFFPSSVKLKLFFSKGLVFY